MNTERQLNNLEEESLEDMNMAQRFEFLLRAVRRNDKQAASNVKNVSPEYKIKGPDVALFFQDYMIFLQGVLQMVEQWEGQQREFSSLYEANLNQGDPISEFEDLDIQPPETVMGLVENRSHDAVTRGFYAGYRASKEFHTEIDISEHPELSEEEEEFQEQRINTLYEVEGPLPGVVDDPLFTLKMIITRRQQSLYAMAAGYRDEIREWIEDNLTLSPELALSVPGMNLQDDLNIMEDRAIKATRDFREQYGEPLKAIFEGPKDWKDDYRAAQQEAKRLDIPADKSHEELIEAIESDKENVWPKGSGYGWVYVENGEQIMTEYTNEYERGRENAKFYADYSNKVLELSDWVGGGI